MFTRVLARGRGLIRFRGAARLKDVRTSGCVAQRWKEARGCYATAAAATSEAPKPGKNI